MNEHLAKRIDQLSSSEYDRKLEKLESQLAAEKAARVIAEREVQIRIDYAATTREQSGRLRFLENERTFLNNENRELRERSALDRQRLDFLERNPRILITKGVDKKWWARSVNFPDRTGFTLALRDSFLEALDEVMAKPPRVEKV